MPFSGHLPGDAASQSRVPLVIDLLEALTPSKMDHPRTDVIGRKASAGYYCQVVSPDFFSAKRPLPHPARALAHWWKGTDSNPRPRHDEPAASFEIGIRFNSLPKGARSDWHDESPPTPAGLPHRTRVLAQLNSARRPERSNFPIRSGREAASPDGRCAARDRTSDATPDPRASARADRGPAAVPRLDHRPRRVPQGSSAAVIRQAPRPRLAGSLGGVACDKDAGEHDVASVTVSISIHE